MQQLIRLHQQEGRQVVSARELYEFLGGAMQHYARWFKKNITANQFAVENEDWAVLPTMGNTSNGGRPTQDFALTLDFAKRLSMMARTARGEEARNYFLECERMAKASVPQRALSPAEMLLQQAQMLVDHERKVQALEAGQAVQAQKLREIEAKITTRPEYFTIMGYARLNEVQVGLNTAAQLGKRAQAICKARGWVVETIPDPRFGKVGTYPIECLREVFATPL